MDTAGLRGIAANPSTPPEILLRLAGHAGLASALLGRDHLPPAVVAALSTHPDPEVRAEVAQAHATTFGALAADSEPRVRVAVARNHRVPEEVGAALAGDPDPAVRRAVAGSARRTDVLHRLVADPDPDVRREALSRARTVAPATTVPLALAEPFLPGDDRAISMVTLTPELIDRFRDDRAALARNPSLPPGLMPGFLDEGTALAENPALPPAVLEALVATGDPGIHRELLRRPRLPDRLRRQLLAADEDDEPLPYVPSLRDAPLDVRLSYLDHPNPAFRRTLALTAGLPPDAVRRLATDDDWPTRLLICERYTDVPPEVLVDAAEGHPGHSRWDLFRHPGLPADTVARNATGDDPVVRHAIATRADVPPDVLDTLLGDPDPGVRDAAAANPTLAPHRIRQLLEDPDTREAAARNPALPAEIIRSVASGGPT